MSKYIPILEKMAREEIPSLQFDVQSATNTYQLREVLTRALNILSYVVHDRVLDEYAARSPQPPAPTRMVPRQAPPPPPQVQAVPPAPPAPRAVSPQLPALPPPISAVQPGPSPTIQGVPSDAIVRKGETNVIITAHGTTVVGPGGQTSSLAPGEPVPAELTSGLPPVPPPAPEGVANVVLPQGGAGLTPDVEAALANLSADRPPEPPR
jgi:hypothetical protein